MAQMIPVETVQPGQTLVINEGPLRRSAYLIHEVESLYDGVEFVITYGTESGRWTDTVCFEAGELVEAA